MTHFRSKRLPRVGAERSVIRPPSRGSAADDGRPTAAPAWTGDPHGFLITHARAVGDAPGRSSHPGRPRHPGGEPEAVARALVRDTGPPAAVTSSPRTGTSGFSWRDARCAEHRNTGPGATPSAARPRPGGEDARSCTVAGHLAGVDGRAPYARSSH